MEYCFGVGILRIQILLYAYLIFIHDSPFVSLVIKGRTLIILIFLLLSDLYQAVKKFPDLLSFDEQS